MKDKYKNFLLITLTIILLALIIYSIKDNKIKDGNKLRVNYIGTLEDGTIFDTNIKQIAIENNLFNEQKTYEPFEFTIGANKVVHGFEKNIKTMKINENKIFTILPEEAYGEYKEELINKNLKREVEIDTKLSLTKKEFEEAIKQEPTIGLVINVSQLPWSLTVEEISENITRSEELKINQEITLPGISWPSKVIRITEEKITLYQYPELYMQVFIPTQTGMINGKISRLDDTTYDIDLNHELAGKSLTFNVTLLDVIS